MSLYKIKWLRFFLSKLYIFLAAREKPKLLVQFVIHQWIKKYRIEMEDYVVPKEGFKNFREFHARPLKKTARTINIACMAIFPADGIILKSGCIKDGKLGQVKEIEYNLDQLLEEKTSQDPYLQKYWNGYYINLYLPFESCHRWVSSFDGYLLKTKYIRGDRFSLDLKSLFNTKGIYSMNERVVQCLSNEKIEMILIGVGGIAATQIFTTHPKTIKEKIKYNRGEELGAFYFGSSLVILFPNNIYPHSFGVFQKVKLGQPMVSLNFDHGQNSWQQKKIP